MANSKEDLTGKRALLYARVSTQQQVQDGMSLDIQEKSLRDAAEKSGYTDVVLLKEEGRSAKSLTGRPVVRKALAQLESGEAHAMFVTRIDRLARSTRDFLSVVDHSQKFGWRLILLDLNLDTALPSSRFVVTIMSALAEMERGIISERQKDVHRYRRETGKIWGVNIGPKPMLPQAVIDRVLAERAAGKSFRAIAKGLNADGVPTAFNKQWTQSTVSYVLDRNS
jgi:DNA invertase Pin-like site-specific DNA recombinase